MISEELLKELNEQIKFEFYSAHFYLSLSAYCFSIDYDGFGNFFLVQAEEERFHAMKFFNFVNDMNKDIEILGLETPPNNFNGLLDVIEVALKHEEFVTSRIYLLSDLATKDREHATLSFLKWFIDEQVEEESNFRNLYQKVKRANGDNSILFALDNELATRTFIPPVN